MKREQHFLPNNHNLFAFGLARKIGQVSLLTLLLAACGSQTPDSVNGTRTYIPKNAEASKLNVQLGLGYLQQGNRELAKLKLQTALEQAPHSAEANDALAYFLEATGEYEKADAYYKKAISFAHSRGASLNNYGTYLCRRGQYALSERYFLSAVKDPRYVNVADAYENAGLCTLQIPDLEKAKSYFQTALKQDPKRPTSILELGVLYYKQGDYKAAEDYSKQYAELAVPTAESTLLSYRIANRIGDKSQAASAAMLLRSKFAESKEFQTYQVSQGKTQS